MPYSALLTGVLLKRVILGSYVLIAMNIVQYTLINWLPTIFTAQGISLEDSIVSDTMNMFGASFGIFIVMLMMNKIPHKVMGMRLSILIVMLGYIYSLQASMLLIMLIGFLLTTFVYMYVYYVSVVYVPEIWPTGAKLRGSGLANAVGRVSGIAVPYAVAVLLGSCGVTGIFILLGTVSTIIAIAITTIGIGTKGVPVENLSIGVVANK